MVRRRLPTGIQTFRTLRERNCYYVDKTRYVERLLDGGKALFEGLHIHGRHDWSQRHPVVVRAGGQVYLFEFKVTEQAGEGTALAQLRERDYAAKYRGGREPIHLLGVEFSRATRNVTSFEVAAG